MEDKALKLQFCSVVETYFCKEPDVWAAYLKEGLICDFTIRWGQEFKVGTDIRT